MWECPVCHRKFKRNNQNHFCSVPLKTVDDYLIMLDDDKRSYLSSLRNIIVTTAKGGAESIKWQMPAYTLNNTSLYYYACKGFYALCVGEEIINCFSDELNDYHVNKGTLHLPYKDIDTELIIRIIKKTFDIRQEISDDIIF